MKNRILTWVLPLVLLGAIVVFSVEESRTFVLRPVHSLFYFLKENLFTLLTAFFLVKGKFVLTLFLKKIALLSATGLGKRYVIEKVLTHNFKIHFLDHITDDIKRLIAYVKKNFKNFPIVKQIIAVFVFLSSLGFIGKFMGGMLAMKVFIAKFWSFLLAIFLKVGTAIIYFFTDYLWGSWIAPIVEVVIFTWILSWMEKVPFLAKSLTKISTVFSTFFSWVAIFLEKVFHLPVKRFLKWLVKKIQKSIYRFIGYQKVSRWKRLKQNRILTPNAHTRLLNERKGRVAKKKETRYLSSHAQLLEKRKVKK
ncbi:hypothetical protein [Sulfurovum sp.]|uniref:hypothetical protein n=1 Tax=Sulfurovum sp. TaxID=1969726 RepID=UPI0028681CE2|nr:hypothetical protein [Sulfurovum sp.]